MSETLIMGFDCGYGDCKVTIGSENGIKKKFKFPTLVGITKKLENVDNPNIYEYDGNFYMIGNNAKHLPSQNLIDITDYKNLEYFTPLLIEEAKKMSGFNDFQTIVCGLSIAQINNSGYFQEQLEKYKVNNIEVTNNIIILPQGAGAKLTVDKYGADFPNVQTEFLGESNYILCDIGFNTLDTLMVNNGKTDPNLFSGRESAGLVSICEKVAKLIFEKHNRQLTLHEAKEILDSGFYKLRGQKYDYSVELKTIKDEYLKNLLKLIDSTYPQFIDKSDFIFVCGGGSAIFKSTQDGFIKIPKSNHEFYNSIGFYLYGLKFL